MGNGRSANGRPIPDDEGPVARITAAIRELAYASWAHYQAELDRDTSRALFERVYLGHYSTIDTYVIKLIDDYGLDVKLDEAIAEPFRSHVDIDVSAFGRALVASATIYTLLAAPVGVWVFTEEIG
ncbi:MAG: hypothetical protein QOE23_1281 [Pseudonocardiales bacterium]|jgi:hypothetical protein|nr:hypothetical protein [Pseudonocardiales bacterium]